MSYPNNESMMYRLKGLIYGVISSATFGLIPLFALPAIRNVCIKWTKKNSRKDVLIRKRFWQIFGNKKVIA